MAHEKKKKTQERFRHQEALLGQKMQHNVKSMCAYFLLLLLIFASYIQKFNSGKH